MVSMSCASQKPDLTSLEIVGAEIKILLVTGEE